MVKRNRYRERLAAWGARSPDEAPLTGEVEETARPATVPPAGIVQLTSPADAQDLAERLLTPGRLWPVIVVTIASDRDEPFLDVDQLKLDLGDLAEVVLMPTNEVSWAFSNVMPEGTQVYGGAARVYPVDHSWVTDIRRSPLRFAYAPLDGERVLARLVDDALAAALSAGLIRASASPRSPRREGTVAQIIGSRALVAMDDGLVVTVSEELTVPGVPLDRVLAVGQRIAGVLDRAARRLDVRPASGLRAGDGAAPLDYRVGDVVLADVTAISKDDVTVRLRPDTTVVVPRGVVTGNPRDALADLFTLGEVVLARVSGLTGASFALRLDDVDEREGSPLPAPSLLDGGPPWLLLPEGGLPSATTAPEPTAPRESSVVELPAHAPELEPLRSTPRDLAPPRATANHQQKPPTPAHAVPSTSGLAPSGPPSPGPPTPGPAVQDLSLALAAARAEATHLRDELESLHRDAERLRAADRAKRTEIDSLRMHASELSRDLTTATARVANFQTRYRTADQQRQKLEREVKRLATQVADTSGPDLRAAFVDPQTAFRHEVYVEWIQRIPAAEKDALPLANYTLGSDFLCSLDEIEGVSRAKVVSVVVEILTGEASHSSARKVHPLRGGPGGDDPARTRASDGATAWRVALQQGVPAARRLHYWRIGVAYELARVVVHNDFRI